MLIILMKIVGKSREDKVKELRDQFASLDIDAMVITALDEVAWFLNIRGADVPNEPVVLGYIYISADQLVFFADLAKVTGMQEHLKGIEYNL